MKRVKQLSLFLDNKPGAMARVCAFLARKRINILGMSVVDTHDHAVIRLIVDEPRTAAYYLEEQGLLLLDDEVLMLDLPNRIGSLGAIARKLAHANISIQYSYGTADATQEAAQVVLSVSDIKKAEKVLRPLLK